MFFFFLHRLNYIKKPHSFHQFQDMSSANSFVNPSIDSQIPEAGMHTGTNLPSDIEGR